MIRQGMIRQGATRWPASIPAGAALIALAGCTYWAKPGGTRAEFEWTDSRCEADAFARFPTVLQTVLLSPGYVAPVRTDCQPTPNGPRCVTVGGEFVPPSYSTVDINSQPRSASARSCLIAAGWQPAGSREEADAITRSVPGVPPPGPRGPVAPRPR